MTPEVRWHYRFRNFSRAYTLLSEALEPEVAELNELEREGAIQRFEYTFQLAWLTLKDRLEYGGVVLTEVTPRNIIQQAFAAKLIDDAEVWIDMLVDRNLMSHTYDFARFQAVLESVRGRYLPVLSDLYQRFGLEALG
ncbi:MAG: nucleotidyltransferase substrate binding protein [Chloroflexota bacterium]|nr:nucleotidyltransferase substrate binding protein [Chloroflexota bacterium]MDE2683170.1 nucleotidyltransferase substrate binding protein [Chloroflexota bacterium]